MSQGLQHNFSTSKSGNLCLRNHLKVSPLWFDLYLGRDIKKIVNAAVAILKGVLHIWRVALNRISTVIKLTYYVLQQHLELRYIHSSFTLIVGQSNSTCGTQLVRRSLEDFETATISRGSVLSSCLT